MVDHQGRWFPDYPGQQPFMDPQFTRIYGQQPSQMPQQGNTQPQQTGVPSAMTPPTIHAEIIQVDGEAAAEQYPVGAGMSQMMMARDESAIFIKTATANGYTLDIFDKQPPAPQPAPFNPADYVRVDELQRIVTAEVKAAISAAMQPTKQPTRPKKETEATAE